VVAAPSKVMSIAEVESFAVRILRANGLAEHQVGGDHGRGDPVEKHQDVGHHQDRVNRPAHPLETRWIECLDRSSRHRNCHNHALPTAFLVVSVNRNMACSSLLQSA
jgi:hypothetical protein